MDQSRPASQKFPAGLAGVLNAPDDNRDSAYYSSTDASSKRSVSRCPYPVSLATIGLLKWHRHLSCVRNGRPEPSNLRFSGLSRRQNPVANVPIQPPAPAPCVANPQQWQHECRVHRLAHQRRQHGPLRSSAVSRFGPEQCDLPK